MFVVYLSAAILLYIFTIIIYSNMALLVSMAFKRGTDDALVGFTNTAHLKMSTNSQYAAFKSLYEDADLKKQAFVVCIAAAVLGGKNQTADRNAARKALIKILVAIGHQLEDAANDDERFITDAGYEIRNTARSSKKARIASLITSIDTPTLKAENLDTPCFVRLTWNEVDNGIIYLIRHKKQSETVWQSGNHSDGDEFTFTNLESETVYEFEISALGPNNLTSSPARAIPVYVS